LDKAILERLEAKGRAGVLEEMACGGHGQPGSPMRYSVDAWLRSKHAVAEADSSAKRDAREEATLAIAKEANRLASEANSIARLDVAAASRSARWAMYAAIIAAIGALIATKDQIFTFIFGHL
jgi:hypothetical protein